MSRMRTGATTKEAQPDHTRILAVDDEQAVLNIYQQVLCPPRPSGDSGSAFQLFEPDPSGEKTRSYQPPPFDLTLCRRGEEAMEAVRCAKEEGRPYSVVFLDGRVPQGKDGVWTAAQMRAMDPNLEIVMVWAYSDVDLLDVARLVPPADKLLYVQKPFHAWEILQLASALCAKQRAEDLARQAHAELKAKVQEGTAELERANAKLGDDIAERRWAEEALRESQEKYRRVVENASEAILVVQDGRLVFTNPKATDISGYSAEELSGRPFAEFIHPADRDMVAERYVKRLKGEDLPPIYTFKIVNKEGATVWVEINAVRVVWEGRPATLNFLADVTHRVRLEEQLRHAVKMESLGRLAGGIAHDFNNILTVINGFADLLRMDLPSSDPRQELVTRIREAGRRAAGLTQRLLAFSRKQAVEPHVLDVNDVVRGLDGMLRRTMRESIEMETILATDLRLVKVDPTQMEQVIINLVVNARDAMPDGGKLTIETANVVLDEDYASEHLGTQAGGHVMLAVSDTGIGMSEEVKAHLFEPFFTTKEVGKGTGLGLASAYGMVKQSRGSIYCYSEEGLGTTFKVYLPTVGGDAKGIRPEMEGEEVPGGTETVLLVEDDQTVRELAARVLEKAGYTCMDAGSGDEALEQARHHSGPIDLLLTDVVMPRMSGRELAERITGTRPGVKLLYMSGYTDDAVVHHSVLEPGTAFIQKPFSPDSLARRVRDVLEGQ